jgi:choline-glycine betaine transporter
VRRANALMQAWPWAGLLGAALGWAFDHQAGGDGIFYECGRGVLWTTIVGVLGLLLTAASGFASFRLWRSDKETPARRFVALLGMLFAVLLAIAIVLPTVAGFIMPECLT